MPEETNFTFRADKHLLSACLNAVRAHAVPDRWKEMRQRVVETLWDHAKGSVRRQGSVVVSLEFPEASMLADVLNLAAPEEIADDERVQSAVRHLAGALGDYSVTRLAGVAQKISDSFEKNPPKGLPSPAEEEQRRYREKRDEIFRHMVGRSARLNIWGNVVEDDPVHEKDESLREKAKTHNFAEHPLQTARIRFSDPSFKEKLAEINESLRKGSAAMASFSTPARGARFDVTSETFTKSVGGDFFAFNVPASPHENDE